MNSIGRTSAAPADHHPAAQVVGLGRPEPAGIRGSVPSRWFGTMAGRLGEPEPRQAGQHAALVRDRRRQHDVEGGDPVRRDEQQAVRRRARRGRGPCRTRTKPRSSGHRRRLRTRRVRAVGRSSASRRAMTSATWRRKAASSKHASRRSSGSARATSGSPRQELAQRRPLVGGAQGVALDDRVGLLARRARLLDERDQHARLLAWRPSPRSMFSRMRSGRTTRPSTRPANRTSM